VLPGKSRDYVFALFPDPESADARAGPTSLREGSGSLPTALRTGDAGPFAAELCANHDRAAAA
jgi:hypothetical protein